MKQRKVKQKIYNFTAVFEPAEEGGYVVYIPALPGCMTQGETFEEAAAMAKDAIEGCVATMKDLKQKVPLEAQEGTVISRIPVAVF